jgi:hypothetical protein
MFFPRSVSFAALALCATLPMLTGCGAGAKPAADPSNDAALGPKALDHASTPETHRKAVDELFAVMHLGEKMDSARESVLKVQMQANPKMAPFEDVMRQFLKKYVSLDGVREPLTRLYMDRFSELELLQIASFYKTPLGKRVDEEFPKLVEEGAKIGAQQVADHKPELEVMLHDAMKRMRSDKGP